MDPFQGVVRCTMVSVQWSKENGHLLELFGIARSVSRELSAIISSVRIGACAPVVGTGTTKGHPFRIGRWKGNVSIVSDASEVKMVRTILKEYESERNMCRLRGLKSTPKNRWVCSWASGEAGQCHWNS